ncbi:hypothetical protein GCM10010187_57850 [Actinomadura coerulea]|nr:hypothetical protein GCM10010187_57850 [Actinomadura coerulea]
MACPRQVINGFQWKIRTGADGSWDRLPAHVQVHDDAIVRAHQHAAGARHPRQTEIGRVPRPPRMQPV